MSLAPFPKIIFLSSEYIGSEKPSSAKTASNSDTKKGRQNDKEQKKLQNKLSKVESEISSLEKAILDMDAQISEDFEGVSKKPDFYTIYQGKKDKLDELMEGWSELDDLINA